MGMESHTTIMDLEAGSELFASYEAELKLVQADMKQKLDQMSQASRDMRSSVIGQVERTIEEAREILDQMRIEKQNIAGPARVKVNQRFQAYQAEVDIANRQLEALNHERLSKFSTTGQPHRDPNAPVTSDTHLQQRQQLLAGAESLERSSQRLRESHRIALQTEEIGASTLADLARQRETILHTRNVLLESEGYTDRSIRTLRGMARR